MDCVVARVKNRGKQKYRKLLSEKSIYNIKIEEYVAYDPSTLLEEGQWYRIEEFSEKEYCIDLLVEPWNSTGYEQLNSIDIPKIDYICSYQGQNDYCFQKIYKNNLIKNKWFLHIGDDVKLEENKNTIIINDWPDAVYRKDQDCLYFRKLNVLSSVFPGIEMLYREATKEEVEDFLSESFIDLDPEYTVNNVGVANRKRIAMAIDALEKMSKKQRKSVFRYTEEYYPELKYDGKKFQISTDDDLKKLLYGIDQRYYTTPVTGEKRIANSITKI